MNIDTIRNDHFNPAPPTILHIDLNSCFATVEQQANPLLRGRPIGVAAYSSPNGCVLAPSIEAKRYGCKTGMRVKDCRQLCPDIVILSPDPSKYRFVHIRLKQILSSYSDQIFPKSVDEFVLDLAGTQALKRGIAVVAKEIKQRIKRELGSYLTVSIGIAPNRSLAKLAAGLHKPDGLDVIDVHNYLDIYRQIELTDLPGINVGYAGRLSKVGVYSVMDMLNQSLWEMHHGFKSVVGDDWYARLRGWEVDEVEFGRKSFSNTHALKIPIIHQDDIFPLMSTLLWKTASRMRIAGYHCYGTMLGFRYRTGERMHDHIRSKQPLFSSTDLFRQLETMFWRLPREYVTNVDVGVFDLCSSAELQLQWIEDVERKESLYAAIDKIEHDWGRNTIHPARMLPAKHLVLNRLPFGGGKEMEQYVFNGEDI
jgi:DNA polymerase IV